MTSVKEGGEPIEVATRSPERGFTPSANGLAALCDLWLRGRRRFRPTIFIECTHTYHSDSNTGIQRVVRNIVRHAPAWADGGKYDVVPVIWTPESFVAIRPYRVLGDTSTARETAYQKKKKSFREKLVREAIRPFRRLASRFFVHFRSMPRRLAQVENDSILYRLEGDCNFGNCILLLLDSSWIYDIWPLSTRFQRQGGTVVSVIYDLIPLTNPEWVGSKDMCASFAYWIDKIRLNADGVITISKTVAGAVKNYFYSKDSYPKVDLCPIRHFYLGSELDLVKQGDRIGNDVKNIFDLNVHVFIVVGSIEPRKNHTFILDAFDHFWANGGKAALVVIGRQGWCNEGVLERIANHPEFGTQLYLLRRASDAELDFCYCNASCLLFASFAEGFGLPIVEAFQRGLAVMCSDIPIFREIAGGRARFFDLSSADNLTRDLEDFCQSVDLTSRKNRAPQGWIGWSESVKQLLNNVVAIRAMTLKKRRGVGRLSR